MRNTSFHCSLIFLPEGFGPIIGHGIFAMTTSMIMNNCRMGPIQFLPFLCLEQNLDADQLLKSILCVLDAIHKMPLHWTQYS
jgi:hypothetical protein